MSVLICAKFLSCPCFWKSTKELEITKEPELFLECIFAEHKNSYFVSQLLCFRPSTVAFYCCLSSTVAVEKPDPISHVAVHLMVSCLFSLAAFKNSLCLLFCTFTITCLGRDVFFSFCSGSTGFLCVSTCISPTLLSAT